MVSTALLRSHGPGANARCAGVIVLLMLAAAAGCAKKQPPIARPTAPPPGSGTATGVRPATPPEPVSEPTPVPPEPVMEEPGVDARSLDELNRDSPFRPVFFDYDSAEISPTGQTALDGNAELMRKFSTWIVTIEGHCDERGTAEYNLALGERRAMAARNYLVSLGIPATRLRTVSYGKEFPFDPGKSEESYAKNRRAHFVVTSK